MQNGFFLYLIRNDCPLRLRYWCSSDELAFQDNGAVTIKLKYLSHMVLMRARNIRVGSNVIEIEVPDQFRSAENHGLCVVHGKLQYDEPKTHARNNYKVWMPF